MSEREIMELKELNKYLKKKLGIGSNELIGCISALKRDISAKMQVVPPQYAMNIPVTIKQGTRIKIQRPCCSVKFQSLKDNIVFEILEPQIGMGIEKLEVEMKELIESIIPIKNVEPFY